MVDISSSLYSQFKLSMNSRILALLATSIATIIYGVTFTVAKDLMPMYLKPFGFIVLRVGGAAILFWSIGFFIKKQAIEKKDFKRIVIASFFGIALNMLTFFKGLSYTTPISASVMMLTAPILVLVFASLILKERLFLKKSSRGCNRPRGRCYINSIWERRRRRSEKHDAWKLTCFYKRSFLWFIFSNCKRYYSKVQPNYIC